MAKEDLVDNHVSTSQCKRALDALLSFETKREEERTSNELLPGKEPNIWLVMTTKRMQPTHKIKPVKIPIAHPLVDPRTTSICLITKDPQREYKDLLEAKGIKFISRVVGVEKLKGKFKPFEARRMLLKENGLFLADDRVVSILPKLLGSKWFQAKKQPIPVCLTRKDLKGELERAISSTYMHQNQGTCTSIKIGTLSQKPAHILENITMALPAIAQNVKDGWDNIQSLCIKTNSSTSLPIWSCSLDDKEGGRWAGMTAKDSEAKDMSADGSSDSDKITTPPVSTKGKRRASDEVEVREMSNKKAKGSKAPVPAKSKPEPTPSNSATAKALKAAAKDKSTPSKKGDKAKLTSPSKKATATSKGPDPGSTDAANPAAPTPARSSKDGGSENATPRAQKEKKAPLQSSKDTHISLSQKELKQKRVGASDKKKEKSITMKESKSVKSALLGKKAAKAQ